MAEYIFITIVVIFVAGFFIERLAAYLNKKCFPKIIPAYIADIYDRERLIRSEAYHRAGYRLSTLSESVSFVVVLLVIILNVFPMFNSWVLFITNSPLIQTSLFFIVILIAGEVLTIGFDYYNEFVIEKRFGFNKMKFSTFVSDKFKSWLILLIIGGVMLWIILGIYQRIPDYFWLLAWGVLAVFSLLFSLLYSDIIVPLFNKQTPLPEGELRAAIENFATKTGFEVREIYVLDGSKRSTKANAYFSGWGPRKRIVLYDTLIEKHSTEELVAVLAHEIGHYRHRHVLKGAIISLVESLILFYMLGLFLREPVFTDALGLPQSFHTSLLVFAILWSPFSAILSLFSNRMSVKFEFQADIFAAKNYAAEPLMNALKKLSTDHLSHPAPHPFYVALHYSHPPLETRLRELGKLNNQK